uniref:Uncharacterized protein n=1 Tax=Lepeophtheirus salmonis TaxID=72036 RepID=A0A0K2UIX0_LEPSM
MNKLKKEEFIVSNSHLHSLLSQSESKMDPNLIGTIIENLLVQNINMDSQNDKINEQIDNEKCLAIIQNRRNFKPRLRETHSLSSRGREVPKLSLMVEFDEKSSKGKSCSKTVLHKFNAKRLPNNANIQFL